MRRFVWVVVAALMLVWAHAPTASAHDPADCPDSRAHIDHPGDTPDHTTGDSCAPAGAIRDLGGGENLVNKFNSLMADGAGQWIKNVIGIFAALALFWIGGTVIKELFSNRNQGGSGGGARAFGSAMPKMLGLAALLQINWTVTLIGWIITGIGNLITWVGVQI